jgi:hypothetical protein
LVAFSGASVFVGPHAVNPIANTQTSTAKTSSIAATEYDVNLVNNGSPLPVFLPTGT